MYHLRPCIFGRDDFVSYKPVERELTARHFRDIIHACGLASTASAVDRVAWDELVTGERRELLGSAIEPCFIHCLDRARDFAFDHPEGDRIAVMFDRGIECKFAGLGHTSVRTNLRELSLWARAGKVCFRTKITVVAYVVAVLFVAFRRLRADAVTRTGLTNEKFGELLKASKRENWVPVAVNLSNEEMYVELISLFQVFGKLKAEADKFEAIAAWLKTNAGGALTKRSSPG
jgi:hypothetical protein